MFNRFNDKQLRILAATGKYKFVGYSHLKKLGIEKHSSNLSTLVKDLSKCRKPFLKEVPHRPQHEKKFYLTKRGAELLVELEQMEADKIQFPKHTVNTSSQEQKHRSQTVNFQIELDLFCMKNDIQILFEDRYFDKTGNSRERNLKSKTAIVYEGVKTIKADMIFMLQFSNEQKALYTFEHENGNDSGKSFDKLIEHGKAILLGSLNKQHDFFEGYRTLWVFENDTMIDRMIERAKGNSFFERLGEYFLMKSEEDTDDNIYSGWRNLNGEVRRLF